MKPTPVSLDDAIGTVEAALAAHEAAFPKWTGGAIDWKAREATRAAMIATLEAAGAKVNEKWDGARLRFAGVAASSTSGIVGAAHNWLKAARTRQDGVVTAKVGDTLTIAGVPVTVASDADCEAAEFVVCGDATAAYPWGDNVLANCALCGVAVVHRPHAPKRPMKLCLACFVARAEAVVQ